ncbi:MAG TPA: ABC transporter substrate-binding protein [Planosporangium sp.]|jgi:polar amino acid transport system substrate-binding protein|nr:ABC transporter substrate-binding protein [Planosporangium sp.]
MATAPQPAVPQPAARTVSILAVAALATALAACAPQADNRASSAPSGQGCGKDQLKTLHPGKLTIGTDDPAYQPWFADNKPDNGNGFESAVAYAVADKLGFARGDVAWSRVTFNNAIQPGPKAYDFDINEFSITDERKKAVDFSSPYYDVRQTVIALKSSKIAGAKSLADLKGAKLGAQVGTTSYKAVTEVVKPTGQPQVFNSNDDAKQALRNGQIDGLVVDLPTAFYITGAEITDAAIVGQLPQPAGQPEQFGLVLDTGSALTACVSQAVDALRSNGTLDSLQQKWLSQQGGAPELK